MWEEIRDKGPYDKFISFQPIWLYATFNKDVVNLWQNRDKKYWPYCTKQMSDRILVNKQLTKYSCLVQVCLHSIEEVHEFMQNARQSGIYVKSVYQDEIPEGDF